MFSWKTSECISNKLKYYKQFSQIQPGNPNSTWLFNHSCSAGHRNFYQSYEAVRATSGKSLYLSCERNSALPPFLNKNTSLAALAQQRHLITSFCWSTKTYKPPIERKGKEALLLITKQIQYTLYSLLSTPQQACWFPPTSTVVPPRSTFHPAKLQQKQLMRFLCHDCHDSGPYLAHLCEGVRRLPLPKNEATKLRILEYQQWKLKMISVAIKSG